MVNGTTSPQEADPNKAHRDIARWTLAVAVFTFLLFVVSGVSDYFIWQQYVVANEAQRDTREQLRAVVNPVGGEAIYSTSPTPDHKILAITFIANFRNNGGTRTAWFHGWISAHYFDGAGPPNNLDLTKPYDKIDTSDTVIGPNAVTGVGPATIFGNDVDRLLARQGIGLVWGYVEYADIFDPAKSHPIGFCLLVTPVQPNPAVPPGGLPPLPSLTPYRSDCNYSR